MPYYLSFEFCSEGYRPCRNGLSCNKWIEGVVNEIGYDRAKKIAEQHVSEYNGQITDFYKIPQEQESEQ